MKQLSSAALLLGAGIVVGATLVLLALLGWVTYQGAACLDAPTVTAEFVMRVDPARSECVDPIQRIIQCTILAFLGVVASIVLLVGAFARGTRGLLPQ